MDTSNTSPKTKTADDASLVIPSRSVVKHDVVATANTQVKPMREQSDVPSDAGKTITAPKSVRVDAAPIGSAAKTSSSADSNEAQTTTKAAAIKEEASQQAVQRERELQEYIRSRKYFVPIDPAARKRSVRMSFGLIVVLLLLAAVLIDLLLDSGVILLLQKIPHTHFFDLQD